MVYGLQIAHYFLLYQKLSPTISYIVRAEALRWT